MKAKKNEIIVSQAIFYKNRLDRKVFVSSPETLDSQGELIVYPWTGAASVVLPPFLAHHLSQRLIGELTEYPWSGVCLRPSVVHNA